MTEREVQAKLSSCFRLGVAPLKDAQIALLSERVHALEKITDMAGFFEDQIENGSCAGSA